MNLTNDYGAPESIVAAVRNDPYTKDGADFSVTELIKPPQIRRLQIKHEEEISVDVRDEVWKLLGKGVHAALEQAGDIGIKEQRLHAEHEGVTISGAIDLVNDGVVTDYKVTSVYSVQRGLKEDWEKQLNLYAWLLRKNDIVAESLRIVTICRDWMKSRSYKHDYPQSPVVVLKVPFWSDERQDRYVDDRVRIHTQEETVLCTPEEQWARGVYRVVGDVKKQAVFDTLADAAKFINQQKTGAYQIVDAPGKYIRCESWCDVADFCPQWQRTGARNGNRK